MGVVGASFLGASGVASVVDGTWGGGVVGGTWGGGVGATELCKVLLVWDRVREVASGVSLAREAASSVSLDGTTERSSVSSSM